MFIKNNRFNDALLFFNEFVNIAYANQKMTWGCYAFRSAVKFP